MEDKSNTSIPIFVHESMTARLERTIKRLAVILIVSLAIIFVSNALWLYAWMQYDYSGETVTVDSTDGIANYIGGNGGITNGENYSSAD